MAATNSTAEKKAALAAYYKQWRAVNKEKVKADGAAYYKANKARLNLAAAERYRADPQSYKARATRWAKENPERRYAIFDKFRSEHREIYREYGRDDYARNKELWLARAKAFRAKNPEIIRALKAAWHAEHPGANAHHVGLRRTRKMQAMPPWADMDAIKAMYKEAARLSRQTGTKWHVDHQIPLKHPLVCGLHVAANLQILPAFDNQVKHNAFEVT